MKRWSAGLVCVFAAMLVASPGAAVPAQQALTAKIGKTAALRDEGQRVLVTATVRCPAGSEILEAFVYVTQDGNESDFGSLPAVCDGKRHLFRVAVNAFDTPFHEGKARASGYVLLTTDESTSPTRVIKIKAE
jgi:hypothetical protein